MRVVGLSLLVSPPTIISLALLPQHAAFAVTEPFTSPSETDWTLRGPNRMNT